MELHRGFTPLFSSDFPVDFLEVARKNLFGCFDYLAEHLTDRQYLLGDSFTVADAYCFTILN